MKPMLGEWSDSNPSMRRTIDGNELAATAYDYGGWRVWRVGELEQADHSDRNGDLASAQRAADNAAREWYRLPEAPTDSGIGVTATAYTQPLTAAEIANLRRLMEINARPPEARISDAQIDADAANLDSPDHHPPALDDFRARGFERINRDAPTESEIEECARAGWEACAQTGVPCSPFDREWINNAARVLDVGNEALFDPTFVTAVRTRFAELRAQRPAPSQPAPFDVETARKVIAAAYNALAHMRILHRQPLDMMADTGKHALDEVIHCRNLNAELIRQQAEAESGRKRALDEVERLRLELKAEQSHHAALRRAHDATRACSDELRDRLRAVEQERDELRARLAAHLRNRFDCSDCGMGVDIDEDGCCATCGADAIVIEDGKPRPAEAATPAACCRLWAQTSKTHAPACAQSPPPICERCNGVVYAGARHGVGFCLLPSPPAPDSSTWSEPDARRQAEAMALQRRGIDAGAVIERARCVRIVRDTPFTEGTHTGERQLDLKRRIIAAIVRTANEPDPAPNPLRGLTAEQLTNVVPPTPEQIAAAAEAGKRDWERAQEASREPVRRSGAVYRSDAVPTETERTAESQSMQSIAVEPAPMPSDDKPRPCAACGTPFNPLEGNHCNGNPEENRAAEIEHLQMSVAVRDADIDRLNKEIAEWVENDARQAARIAELRNPVTTHADGCMDCGAPYGGDDWLDFLIPRSQWILITDPDGAGILCASCIVKRASKLPHVIDITGRITFASDYGDGTETPYQQVTRIAAAAPAPPPNVAEVVAEAKRQWVEALQECPPDNWFDEGNGCISDHILESGKLAQFILDMREKFPALVAIVEGQAGEIDHNKRDREYFAALIPEQLARNLRNSLQSDLSTAARDEQERYLAREFGAFMAAKLATLQATERRLREALGQFAATAAEYDQEAIAGVQWLDDDTTSRLTVGDLRRARAALDTATKKGQ